MIRKLLNNKWAVLILAAVISVACSFIPDSVKPTMANVSNIAKVSLVPQSVKGMSLVPQEVTKLYYRDDLIGVIYDRSILETARQKTYDLYYAESFPDSEISLDDNIYLYTEKTYLNYENRDKEIAQYLIDNDLFLVDAYRISIGTDDVIYVKSLDDFRSSLRQFVLNFIDEDVYVKLEKNETILELDHYGEQDVNVSLGQQIISTPTKVSASDIFKNQDEIISYLCYGRDTDLTYYTVQQYDTVDGVASKNGITPDQVVMINPGIRSRNSILQEGMEVNVTPFNSPIQVIVEKERMTKEIIYQPERKVERDESKEAGYVEVTVKGKDGYRDTLYSEIYVNGVLTSYMQKSTKVIEEAVQEVMVVGIGSVGYHDSRFRLPVNNPHLICDYYCYAGHNGADFTDRYDRWGKIYACADGVVISNGYGSLSGWCYMINHGNGYTFRYSHMRTRGFLEVGTEVYMSQYIGDIGMTGWAEGPHVHVAIYINGVNVDPCTVLPCELGRD